jgi:hypothetical protein
MIFFHDNDAADDEADADSDNNDFADDFNDTGDNNMIAKLLLICLLQRKKLILSSQ